MYSPISSTLMILLIPFILILISSPTSTSSNALLNQACTPHVFPIDTKLCLKVLQSQPKVASATNLLDLSFAIIESGISKANVTLTHIKSVLKESSTNPNLRVAMQSCKDGYEGVIGSFKSAVAEIKDKDYYTASYDLFIASGDDIQICEKFLASEGVNDKIVSIGNKIVQIFGLSAYTVVDDLL